MIKYNLNMKNRECNFKLKGKGKSKFDQILERLDKIDTRLDNLENEVHSQFKAHGWTK